MADYHFTHPDEWQAIRTRMILNAESHLYMSIDDMDILMREVLVDDGRMSQLEGELESAEITITDQLADIDRLEREVSSMREALRNMATAASDLEAMALRAAK